MDDNKNGGSDFKHEDQIEIVFKTIEGKHFEITEEGSIGLLALGAVGLKAWRKVRKESKTDDNDTSDETTENIAGKNDERQMTYD